MKRFIISALLVASLALAACAGANIPASADSVTQSPQLIETTATPSPVPTPTPTPSPSPTPVNRSITSGRVVPLDTPMRPFIISVDNADGAKPQTALDQADIIYEFNAEAAITRLQVLFNDNYPIYAGPVRSVRYYFLDLAQEWDAAYLGSDYVYLAEPYLRIGPLMFSEYIELASIAVYKPDKGALNDFETPNGDRFRSGEPGRKSTHSLYVRIPGLVNKFYGHQPTPEQRFLFEENVEYANGEAFTSVSMPYYSKDRPDWIQFAFDADSNRLYRYEDGDPFINRVLSEDGTSYTEEQFSAQNLIIQHVTYGFVPNDKKGRRTCELIGEGLCDYFVNGQHITGRWSRPTAEDYTKYLLDDGSLVTLEPGNTWIAVHPDDREITVYS